MVALNASPALALNPIELTDQRVTNKEGLQLIYEVRTGPTPRFHPSKRRGSDLRRPSPLEFDHRTLPRQRLTLSSPFLRFPH